MAASIAASPGAASWPGSMITHSSPAAGATTRVRDVMTEGVFSVTQDTPARSVVGQMVALNVHHLFVADAAEVVVGVIGTLDVLRKLG